MEEMEYSCGGKIQGDLCLTPAEIVLQPGGIGIEVGAVIDTGATISVVPKAIQDELQAPVIRRARVLGAGHVIEGDVHRAFLGLPTDQGPVSFLLELHFLVEEASAMLYGNRVLLGMRQLSQIGGMRLVVDRTRGVDRWQLSWRSWGPPILDEQDDE